MKITNIAPGPRGIHTLAGSVVLNPGQTIDADLSDAELKGSKETGWFEIGKGAAKEEPAGSAYAVTDKGNSWFVITQDGKEVTKSLRADDVKGFDELSDADKAAFVEANAPA